MFADTVYYYLLITFSMLSFVFECTVQVIRAKQRSPLFPNNKQARANKGTGLSWFRERQSGHRLLKGN